MHQLATAIDIPGEKDRQISGLHCVGVEAGNAIGVHFNAGFRQAEPVDIRSTTERGQHKFHIGTAIVISLHHDAAVFALNGAKAALAEFDKIGKAAKASGLNAESFQELAHAAELGGVNFEQFSQAMNAFNRNAGMAAIGKGELVEKLKQLNPELLKSIQSASTQAERIRLVADALDVETDASRKAAIASAVFGDAGVRMVEVLKGGSAALDETARKARSLGLVVDSHLIARAETLNDEFATATRIIDLNFKQALVNLAPVLATIAKATSILAGDIRKLVDSMLSLENQSNISLEAQMRSLGLERLDVEKRILELRREQDGLGYFDAGRRAVIEQAVAGLEKRMAGIAAEEQKIMQVLEGRNVTTQPPPPNLPPPDPTTRDRAAEAALREAEAIQRLIDDLAHELSLINESDLAKAQANALRQAGANATESQRQQILNLVAAIHEETAALQKNEAAQKSREQSIQAMFKMGEDALISMIDNSLSAEEALKRLVVQLAAAIAQAALHRPACRNIRRRIVQGRWRGNQGCIRRAHKRPRRPAKRRYPGHALQRRIRRERQGGAPMARIAGTDQFWNAYPRVSKWRLCLAKTQCKRDSFPSAICLGRRFASACCGFNQDRQGRAVAAIRGKRVATDSERDSHAIRPRHTADAMASDGGRSTEALKVDMEGDF